jgi:hypothetical protein
MYLMRFDRVSLQKFYGVGGRPRLAVSDGTDRRLLSENMYRKSDNFVNLNG